MENQPQELDIKRYLSIIYKKRYLCIMVAAGIIALIVLASYVMPKSYEAMTTVSIQKNYLNMLMQDIAVTPSVESRIQALSAEMLSRSMLLRVLREVGLDVDKMDDAEKEKLVKRFQKSTQIKVEVNYAEQRDIEIFTVTYGGSEPEFTRDYVNTLVNQYIVESVSAKQQQAIGANRFMFEQMELYKEKIRQVEAELARKKMDKGIEQTRRLPDLQKKYQELLVMYTEQHPEVLRLKAEIDSTMRLLEGKQGGGSDGDSTESDRRTRAASAIKQRNVAELERDREAYKKIYDSLVASIGRSEVSAQVQVQAKGDTFRILDPAVLPIEPAGPARWKIILLAIFAGIAGGVGTAIVLDMMDNTIKSIDMLKDIGLPIIATIPRIQNVEVIVAARKKDRMVYGAAGAYLAFFIVLAIVEFLK
jgi:uncharacterized protein involved in exopolysaccharide biosynthesis